VSAEYGTIHPMRVVVSGSTGFIGSALMPALESAGYSVARLVRPGTHATGIDWDPASGRIDAEALEGCDAVINLAGESIAGLWTTAKKSRIRESRVKGTQLLATSLSRLSRPPAVIVSASATGYYGNRPPDEKVDESGHRGRGFLAEVVEDWEKAAQPAKDAGIRVVHPRFGIVVAGKGGALAPMLPIFRAGLGGKLGSGRQIWSWVALDDVVASILFILGSKLEGPVNVVAPLPVTNLAFTRTLGRVLRRPTVFGVPEIVLKTVAGEMAREMLLSGVRAVPRKLQGAGYAFKYPELEVALRHVLNGL
jgi:uncharacterized protein